MNLYDELVWRGLIKDVSNENLAKKLLNEESISFYCGFDPSAPSLQLGNFTQIVKMLLLEKYGHKPIVLIGGATGLIGDPKQSGERKLLTLEESLKNAEKIKSQITPMFKTATFVNNYDWISKIDVITFLRDYGKSFNINSMLAKDTVANRLENGISYTEFSYMIIQAIDFLHLYQNNNCLLQFGGSDQWGNITSGLDLIRKNLGDNSKVIGMSSPLLTKSDGTKFGKSESGALWLDKELTSPYEMYQYLINTPDADVISYLKYLTLLSVEEINELEIKKNNHPELREAQKALAKEVVALIHGEEEALKAKEASEKVFNSGMADNMPTQKINLPTDINILDFLVNINICPSKSEARRNIEQGGITINKEKIFDVNKIISKTDFEEGYLIVKKGKKTFLKVELNE
ncbi:MAG TPA: tyrosine--tRNA ligase [Bacilli bacterium]|nr:tyrosine--tRNA ligase [Bacilli bacterium]